MVKPACFDSKGMKKGAWSEEEDEKLRAYVMRYGHWNWRLLPKYAGLARCGKSCRLRWMNYLKPGVKRGNFTKQEDEIIAKLHHELGNKWSAIAAKLPGRTDNEIKNHWHTNIKKRGRRNNPTTKHAQGNCIITDESCKTSDIILEEQEFNSEISSWQTIQFDQSPASSMTSAPKEIDQNLDATNSSDSTTQFISHDVDLSWDNPNSSFYSSENDYFPPLQNEEFLNYPQLQFSSDQFSSSSSSSNYGTDDHIDWFSDYDHIIVSSDSVAQAVHGSFWVEPFSNFSQSNDLSKGVKEQYEPFFPYFDHEMRLFAP